MKFSSTIGSIILAGMVLASQKAWAWGAEGHQAIAQAAYETLSASARFSVDRILTSSSVDHIKDIVSAATWPDDVRHSTHPGRYAFLPEGVSFFNRFNNNRDWHFVNYPLKGKYTLNDPDYSSSQDIVHAIGGCISVLEGTAQAPWNQMKKEEALAWLIHLVGDLHQPLHMGEGFYSSNGTKVSLVTNPANAHGLKDDLGGNNLYYTSSEQFHSFWDNDMVDAVANTEPSLKQILKTEVQNHPKTTSGSYHDWAISWATDSIKAANKAYNYLSLNTLSKDSNGNFHVSKPANYSTKHSDLAKAQLVKATDRLRALLNAIQWSP
jgi:hypothetical protein